MLYVVISVCVVKHTLTVNTSYTPSNPLLTPLSPFLTDTRTSTTITTPPRASILRGTELQHRQQHCQQRREAQEGGVEGSSTSIESYENDGC